MAKVPILERKEERLFLEGPRSRGRDLLFALRTLIEFIKAFRALHFVGPCITVFGSARFKQGHPHYDLAMKVGRAIAELGFTTMTGGGPGVMEAANRGAFEAGGKSVGCNIVLPEEQYPNKYMQKWVAVKYFFIRKVLLLKYSYGFIVMPGGAGTMDELFETMTLIQTATIRNFPIVIMCKAYYTHLDHLLKNMIEEKTISEEDYELVFFTDSVSEAMDHLMKHIRKDFVMKRKVQPKKILLEKELKDEKPSKTQVKEV